MKLRFPGFRQKALTLSYDDGVIFDEPLIEIMNRHGLRGTFNINSEMLGNGANRRLTREQILSLYPASGNELAVHGARHLDYQDIPDSLIVRDILQDRLNLEELLGQPVRGMAYPFGLRGARTPELAAQCGIVYSRTTVSTERFDLPTDWLRLPATCHHNNPRLMELGRALLDYDPVKNRDYLRAPKLFYLWGHSYEFQDDDNWQRIRDFAALMGGREDLWYPTNMELWSYVHAYESLIYTARGDMVMNPTPVDLCAWHEGADVAIPAGALVRLPNA